MATARIMRHAGHVLVVAVTLLALSLAIYDCKYTGYCRPGKYDMDIRHTEMGLPSWLVHNRATGKGRFPHFNLELGPEAHRYREYSFSGDVLPLRWSSPSSLLHLSMRVDARCFAASPLLPRHDPNCAAARW